MDGLEICGIFWMGVTIFFSYYDLVSLFNGLLTSMSYLMPELSLLKNNK